MTQFADTIFQSFHLVCHEAIGGKESNIFWLLFFWWTCVTRRLHLTVCGKSFCSCNLQITYLSLTFSYWFAAVMVKTAQTLERSKLKLHMMLFVRAPVQFGWDFETPHGGILIGLYTFRPVLVTLHPLLRSHGLTGFNLLILNASGQSFASSWVTKLSFCWLCTGASSLGWLIVTFTTHTILFIQLSYILLYIYIQTHCFQ